MPFAFAILIGLQLGGEVLRQTLHLPRRGADRNVLLSW